MLLISRMCTKVRAERSAEMARSSTSLVNLRRELLRGVIPTPVYKSEEW